MNRFSSQRGRGTFVCRWNSCDGRMQGAPVGTDGDMYVGGQPVALRRSLRSLPIASGSLANQETKPGTSWVATAGAEGWD